MNKLELEKLREAFVCLKIGSTRAFSIWIDKIITSKIVNPCSEIKTDRMTGTKQEVFSSTIEYSTMGHVPLLFQTPSESASPVLCATTTLKTNIIEYQICHCKQKEAALI